MSESLHTKFRPESLEEFIAAPAVKKSYDSAINSGAHSFLLTGPSGCGKTTLARIIAHIFGCTDPEEVDAATNTGVDDMRNITSRLQYKPLQGETKVIILDEAHMLSKSAWNSLLKYIEEPPEHVYWCICTTEENKVPKTIRTRCVKMEVKPATSDQLLELLMRVGQVTSREVLRAIANSADGSYRQALTNLPLVAHAKTGAEARAILSSHVEPDDVIDLCRLLIQPTVDFGACVKALEGLKEKDNESMRLVIVNYLTAVALKKSKQEQLDLISRITAFQGTYNRSEKLAPLLVALTEICHG